jgi:mycothiol synthase
MYTIRPFELNDHDLSEFVRIFRLVRPYIPITANEMRRNYENQDPNYFTEWLVGELDGQFVLQGYYGQSAFMYHPDKYHFDMVVDPAVEGTTVRTDTLNYVLEKLAPRNPLALHSRVIKTETDTIQFLEQSGFQAVMKQQLSELQFEDFDINAYSELLENVAAEGIEIISLREVQQRDPEWMPRMHDLEWAIMQDVPNPEPSRQMTLEQYAKRFEQPNFSPDLHYVAWVDGEYTGMTNMILMEGDPGLVLTGLTGVRRAYRRRGLALALKATCLQAAKEMGKQRTVTGNEEHNPMYQINLKMGFKPLPPLIDYEKILR